MKNLRYIVASFLFSFSFLISYSQDFLGYANSNYAGVSGIDLNPASIADSRYKFDMTLIGINVYADNNYLGLNQAGRDFLKSGDTTTPFDKHKFLTEVRDGSSKSIFFSSQIVLPSFMITLSPKHAIALNIRMRTMFNADGVDEYLAHQLFEGLKDSANFKRQFSGHDMSLQLMSWMEYGVTYARVLKDENHHFFKAGLRLKFIQGIWAAYAYMKDFSYNFESDTTLTFTSNVNYGHSASFSGDKSMSHIMSLASANPASFGADLGVIYEWRPNREQFRYDMDGKTGLDMRWKEKYKLKAGLSVVDIGSVRFSQTTVGDFNANIQKWDFSKSKADPSKTPVENLDSILKKNKGVSIVEGNQPFSMNLPTTLSLQVDYNIWKDFYANFTTYYAFTFASSVSKAHDLTTFSLTPRWDWKWFGVFVPLSYNSFGGPHMGLSLRLGPLIVGTTRLGPYFSSGDVYGADFHALLKIPIMYGKPHDKDKDKVSNKKDKCKDTPGTWEFMGCPDRDGDHVSDDKDQCPDTPGLPEFNGCPDKDGDKIIDKKDSCPDVAGLAEFNGCPDRDGDKIIDKRDSCPDEAGIAEFFGCPDKDHDGVPDKRDKCPSDSGSVAMNGCPDIDGDGLLDKDDRCPDKPGPKENDGCPLAKLSLLDKQGNIIASATVDKDGRFTFTVLPEDESLLLKLESFDVLIANEATVNWGGKVLIARKGADGFFHFEVLPTEKDKLGKMDIPDVQVKLNKEEAQTVKHAMETLEFDFGSDVIRSSSTDGLDLVKELLDQNPKWRLKLSGHTDNVSSLKYNMNLSKKRVESIKKYLVKKGIKDNRIVLKWYGPTKPIAPNDTEEGRQKNRRVEFLIIK